MSTGLEAPFELRTAVHLVSPTGDRARNLEELRAAIARAPERSLFWHVAAGALREPAAAELPPDDFSAWVESAVQDRVTAERLSFAAQSARGPGGAPRAALIEALETVSERQRLLRVAPEGGEFTLLTFESVVLPSGLSALDAAGMEEALVVADPGAWFFHLVEQPWLGGEAPALLDWLRARGATRLATWLAELAEGGLPLEAMRRRLIQRRRRNALRLRVSEAASHSDGERRAAVEGLVRRVRRLGRRA